MNAIVILQARTNSSRLPGKVLLPLGGMPIVVLAAKRAGNTGLEVLVATSTESSDDALSRILESSGISFFRGSLNDTLARFVAALDGRGDGDVVIRLTADNVLPDGEMLQCLVASYLKSDVAYLCCNGAESGLPYGVSAEVTRVKYLREASAHAVDEHDREHVMPYIIKKYGRNFYLGYKDIGKGNLRATIDGLDDYLLMERAFAGVQDPVGIPMRDMICRVQGSWFQPVIEKPVDKLVFGAVQLGVHYGINNRIGRPSSEDAKSLLKYSIVNGVSYIDTARAYGESERVIGRALSGGWASRVKIVSKVQPFPDEGMTSSGAKDFVRASVFQSLWELNVRALDVLLFHRYSDVECANYAGLHQAHDLVKQGVIGLLGVSVQDVDELNRALDNPMLQHIQLPCNVLDHRWDGVEDVILNAKRKRPITIHVRSSLLQGLLVSNDPVHWKKANVLDGVEIRDWLMNSVRNLSRLGVVDLCFAYTRGLKWVDGVVVGMEEMSQLMENISLFSREPLKDSEIDYIRNTRPILVESVLNPAKWMA